MFESLVKKLQKIYLHSSVTTVPIPDFKETAPGEEFCLRG